MGDPGSGKSTLLKYVARAVSAGLTQGDAAAKAARTLLGLDEGAPLPYPIFATLPDLNHFFRERDLTSRQITFKHVLSFL